MFARLAQAAYKINFVMMFRDENVRVPLNIFDIHELELARDILDEVIKKHDSSAK